MPTETNRGKTKICAIDLDADLISFLEERFDVYTGTLGTNIKAYYERYENECRFLLNYQLPENIHEYEVFIEDMRKEEVLDYDKEDNTRTFLTEDKAYYFYTKEPQTIFNPINYVSKILRDRLKEHRKRPAIKVVFAANTCSVKYFIRDAYNYHDSFEVEYSNYEHLPFPQNDNIRGTQVRLSDNQLSADIYQSFLDDIDYQIIFKTPYTWNSDNKEVEKGFYSVTGKGGFFLGAMEIRCKCL